MNTFTVIGNVPALKNNKKIIQIPIKGMRACPACRNKKGRPMIISSDRHKKYVDQTAPFWKSMAPMFRNKAKNLPKPLRVSFEFTRGSRHKFDYTNALDTIQDLMVKYGWIDDDNADELIPVIVPYNYNKEEPGVTITILDK